MVFRWFFFFFIREKSGLDTYEHLDGVNTYFFL